jgi:hypothetical protein
MYAHPKRQNEKVVVIPDQETIDRARRRAARLGSLKNSIREGRGNFIGYLGEIVVADCYKWKYQSVYDYDVIGYNNVKLDVKTKKCSGPASYDFEASIPAANTAQGCDGYVFASVYQNAQARLVVEILGWIPKPEYFALATFYKKGEPDPKSRTGWLFKADCFNLPYSQLWQIREESFHVIPTT